MEKKMLNIGAETLAYLDEGQGDVVLMLHGNMSSSIHYEPLIERIKDRYRRPALIQNYSSRPRGRIRRPDRRSASGPWPCGCNVLPCLPLALS